MDFRERWAFAALIAIVCLRTCDAELKDDSCWDGVEDRIHHELSSIYSEMLLDSSSASSFLELQQKVTHSEVHTEEVRRGHLGSYRGILGSGNMTFRDISQEMLPKVLSLSGVINSFLETSSPPGDMKGMGSYANPKTWVPAQSGAGNSAKELLGPEAGSAISWILQMIPGMRAKLYGRSLVPPCRCEACAYTMDTFIMQLDEDTMGWYTPQDVQFEIMDRFCYNVKWLYRSACHHIMSAYFDDIAALVMGHFTGVDMCRILRFCPYYVAEGTLAKHVNVEERRANGEKIPYEEAIISQSSIPAH